MGWRHAPTRGRTASASAEIHFCMSSIFQVRTLALILALSAVSAWAGAQVSVELSPPNARYRAQPGDILTGSLTLRNTSDVPVRLSAARSDFVLTPDDTIQPVPAGSLPRSLVSWLTISASDIHIQGHGSQEVRYSMRVPANVKPGTYWATILFRTGQAPSPAGSSGHSIGVQYVAQLAYPLIVDVGKLSPAGKITDIAYKPDTSGNTSKQKIEVTFQNVGDAYLIVKGRVELRNADGTLAGTFPIAGTASFPGGLTHLDVSIAPPLASGTYVATSVLDIGSSNLVAGQARVTVP